MRPATLPFVLSLLSVAALASETAQAPLPTWLSGHWCDREAGDGSEEFWLPPAGGMMIGIGRTATPGRPTQFEFLRIEAADGVATYFGQPQGVPATAFARSAGGSDWIRFENPSHDYPTRIEYRREGEALHARIAGPGAGGKEHSIAFEFVRCGDHAATIRSLFAAFNRHDIDAVASHYADDVYLMSSDFDEPRHGWEGVRQTYSALFAQLPAVHDEIKTVLIDGDQAAVEFVSTWPASGEIPAGRLDIATFFKFHEGKIVSDITYFNDP
jgi:hypothetical protein